MTGVQQAQPESGVVLMPGVDVETQTNLFLSLLVVLLVFFLRRVKVSANYGFVFTALDLVQI